MKRHIPLSGQPNFRDLGGYEAQDGRRVRWGSVYRSGELSQLSEGDVETLAGLGIKTVVDLRSPQEVEARGEGRLPEAARMVRLPIASGDIFQRLIPQFFKGDFTGLTDDLLARVNRVLVRDFTATYAELLQLVLDPANRPLVFHCTQGKDRAGFGAATVLSALGVPWETVVEDYLLSNHFREADNEKLLGMVQQFVAQKNGGEVAVSKIRALLVVQPESLGAARDEILSRHGDMDHFLMDGLSFGAASLERLRDDLLERGSFD